MKNNKYSIRKISAGIVSIIIGLSVGEASLVKAEMSTDNKVIIDENGVRPVGEPISPKKNSSEELINKPTVKPVEKPNKKSENNPSVKPAKKPIEKPGSNPSVKPDRKPLVESTKKDKLPEIQNGGEFPTITDKEEHHDSNNTSNKDLLIASLSGRDIRVEYKKGSISVDKLYVESINNSELNKSIENKLGKDYKVVETFEVHFEKDDKKIDSNQERTVTITIAKKDNAELEVYHVANDNSLEKMDSKYSAGKLQFSVNHFSKFTIVERIRIAHKDLEERAQIVIPEIMENTKNKDDELPKTLTKPIVNSKENRVLPKTGIESMTTEIIGFMLILVAVLLRRKQKDN